MLPSMRAAEARLTAWRSPSKKVPDSYFLSARIMSDDEDNEPIQPGKRTLEAIVDGVVAKLRESPPEKRAKDGSTSSSGGEGEYSESTL